MTGNFSQLKFIMQTVGGSGIVMKTFSSTGDNFGRFLRTIRCSEVHKSALDTGAMTDVDH